MLCVHGNPTWSYLWRRFLAEAPEGWRVVAVDQLGMGFSERPERARTLAQRVADLTAVTDALGVDRTGRDGRARLGRRDLARLGAGPPRPACAPSSWPTPPSTSPPTRPRRRSSGWPAPRRCGTRSAPPRRRSSASPRALSRPGLPADVRDALRRAVRHGGQAARGRRVRRRHPARSRARQRADAGRHRRGSAGAGRRARADAVGPPRPGLLRPLPARPARAAAARARPPLRAGLAPGHRGRSRQRGRTPGAGCRAGTRVRPPRAAASVPTGRRSGPRWRRARATRPPPWSSSTDGRRTISFDLLERRVRELAAGLAATGVRAGDRVALLVPPGADLTAAAYACWRAGAVVVLADAGLGPVGLAPRPARRGARPRHRRGARARAGPAAGHPGPSHRRGPREPGAAPPARLSTRPGRHRAHRPRDRPRRPPVDPDADGRGAVHLRRDRAREGRGLPPPPAAGPARRAARPPTGSPPTTGSWRRSRRSRCTGPRWASPPPSRLHVTAPGTLTAAALADAADAVDATVVFASPAALRDVVATVDGLDRDPPGGAGRGSGWSSPRGRRCRRRCCTPWATSSPAPPSTPRTA